MLGRHGGVQVCWRFRVSADSRRRGVRRYLFRLFRWMCRLRLQCPCRYCITMRVKLLRGQYCFVWSLQHCEDYGDASEQDQDEAEDLECAKVCRIRYCLEEGAADEKAGIPGGDHPRSSQCDA